MAEKTCRTCAWHDGFSWVCFNGESEHRADFTMNDHTCPCWQDWKEAEQPNKPYKPYERAEKFAESRP